MGSHRGSHHQHIDLIEIGAIALPLPSPSFPPCGDRKAASNQRTRLPRLSFFLSTRHGSVLGAGPNFPPRLWSRARQRHWQLCTLVHVAFTDFGQSCMPSCSGADLYTSVFRGGEGLQGIRTKLLAIWPRLSQEEWHNGISPQATANVAFNVLLKPTISPQDESECWTQREATWRWPRHGSHGSHHRPGGPDPAAIGVQTPAVIAKGVRTFLGDKASAVIVVPCSLRALWGETVRFQPNKSSVTGGLAVH